MLSVGFYGDLDELQKIELTTEIGTNKISPIVITNRFRFRYSIKRKAWIIVDADIKTPFTLEHQRKYESMDDVIQSFVYSLLYHDETVFLDTYGLMLNQIPYELVLTLVEYYNEGVQAVSGISLFKVLQHAFSIIFKDYPKLKEKIQNTKTYQCYLIKIGEQSVTSDPIHKHREIPTETIETEKLSSPLLKPIDKSILLFDFENYQRALDRSKSDNPKIKQFIDALCISSNEQKEISQQMLPYKCHDDNSEELEQTEITSENKYSEKEKGH